MIITPEEFNALLECFEDPCDAIDYARQAFRDNLAEAKHQVYPTLITLQYIVVLLYQRQTLKGLAFLEGCMCDCELYPENRIRIKVRGDVWYQYIDQLLICRKWAQAEKESIRAFDWMKKHSDIFLEYCSPHLEIRKAYAQALRMRRKYKEAKIQEEIIAGLEID